jgi:hypothetical protein
MIIINIKLPIFNCHFQQTLHYDHLCKFYLSLQASNLSQTSELPEKMDKRSSLFVQSVNDEEEIKFDKNSARLPDSSFGPSLSSDVETLKHGEPKSPPFPLGPAVSVARDG